MNLEPRTKETVDALRERVTPKATPSADRFVALPYEVVEDIGLHITRGPRVGQVKLNLAVLAGMLWFHQINWGRHREVGLTNGQRITLRPDQFLLSARTVARNLFVRWMWMKPSGELFEQFADRVRHIVRYLERDDWIRKMPSPIAGSRGRQGTVWSLSNTKLEQFAGMFQKVPAPGMLLLRPNLSEYQNGGQVNIVDLIGGLYRAEMGILDAYAYNMTAKTVESRRHPRKYHRWITLAANKGNPTQQHGTVGVFQKEDLDADASSSVMPYVIFDIDAPKDDSRTEPFLDYDAIKHSYEAARRLVRDLVELGCNPSDLICCFSGHRGFHIYLPSGAVGIPLFRDQTAARKILRRFHERVSDEDVDHNLFSPQHLVRVIGSRREETLLYKTAYSGCDFVALPLHEIIQRSKDFAPFQMPDPHEVQSVPTLTRLVLDAARIPPAIPTKRRVLGPVPETWPDAMQRALRGCREGEEWAPGKWGRNALIYNLATFLFRRTLLDVNEVGQLLREVNGRNHPPLPEREVAQALDSARSSRRGKRARRSP